MMAVRKVVIPVAGWGTRFLPATKVQPKEMLPLVNKPLIQHAVEEAVASGIKDVIMVIATGKDIIKDHFHRSLHLERYLRNQGKDRLLEEVQRVSSVADIRYVYQRNQLGLGHAVLMAQELVGDEPFAVILPDDIMDCKEPALKQLLDIYDECGSSVIGVERVRKQDVIKYGIIRAEKLRSRLYKILDLVEKPSVEQAPSNLGVIGRYVITPQIFRILRATQLGAIGEIQLTDGLKTLLGEQAIYACEFEGVRYDTGTPIGMLKASVALGLKNPEMAEELKEYLRDIIT
jgi:UTP--glucose-1-phosphate uridylyltransferase